MSESDASVLCRDVSTVEWEAELSRHAGDIDDVSGAPLLHIGQCRACGVPEGECIYGKDLRDHRIAGLFYACKVAPTGVVDKDIDLSVLPDGVVNELLRLPGDRDVALCGEGIAACMRDAVCELVKLVLPASSENNGRAFACEYLCQRGANPRGSAGNYSNGVCKHKRVWGYCSLLVDEGMSRVREG